LCFDVPYLSLIAYNTTAITYKLKICDDGLCKPDYLGANIIDLDILTVHKSKLFRALVGTNTRLHIINELNNYEDGK